MTIFDRLRYQISIPPKEGELEALPEKLFRYWIDTATLDWKKQDEIVRYDAKFVGSWMRVVSVNRIPSYNKIQEITYDITALRSIIDKWEE